MLKFDGSQPVYIQIVELFYEWIISGKLMPNDKVEPVRKLAAELEVNPNTIQKALGVLDEQGITISEIGRGRFITSDVDKIEQVKDKIIDHDVYSFIKKLESYGLNNSQILGAVEKRLNK